MLADWHDTSSSSWEATSTEFAGGSFLRCDASTSMKSNTGQPRRNVPLFSQLLAVLHRDVTERTRLWSTLLLEILVPLVCIACTALLHLFFGNETAGEMNFVDYGNISSNALPPVYSMDYCYDSTLTGVDGSPNVIDGLPPCTEVDFFVDCEGDETHIPVKGLCTEGRWFPFIDFVEFSFGALNMIPPLDKVLLNHWSAAKKLKRRSSSSETLIVAGFSSYSRFAALKITGSIFIGPSANVSPLLLDYFHSTSNLFKYAYGGTFDDISELNDKMVNDDVFAIILIRNMTREAFDVDIRMYRNAFPPFDKIINSNYPGGIVESTDELYIVSGFLTLQKTVYDYYFKHVMGVPPDKLNFTLYVVSMGSFPYETQVMLRQTGLLIAFMIVLAYLYPVSQIAQRRVLEKELRIREAMQIMGVSALSMNISWLLVSAAIMFITSLLGAVLLRTYVWKTEFFLVFLILFLFSMTAVAFAGLVSTFFSNSRMTSIVAPLLYVAASSTTFVLNTASEQLRIGLVFLSPTALSSALQLLFQYEAGAGLGSSEVRSLLDAPNMRAVLLIMLADLFLYLLLMAYLEEVLPREWGTTKHPLFFILDPLKYIFGRKSTWVEGGPDGRATNGLFEDMPDAQTCAVRIIGLRREFKRAGHSFLAVNNLYLDIPEGGISVLLGHNGAGKSTTVSMITGLTEPDAGDCIVYGNSVRKELSKVRQDIGFCPQHNILWPGLTCREHLVFFGRIKGLKDSELQDDVTQMLGDIDLLDKQDCMSSQLSGGQKRKLSLAMAFIGGGRLVVLDEPTAGMDAAARRHTWDLLRRMSLTHSILLTTHFMDEADILGTQIAIMGRGSLRCCGSSVFLKSRLGTSYTINLALGSKAEIDVIESLIKKHIPDVRLTTTSTTEISYQVPTGCIGSFGTMLRELELESSSIGIRTYAISATTLEDVFLRVVAEVEEERVTNGNGGSGNDSATQVGDSDDCIWNYTKLTRERDIVLMQCSALMRKRLYCTMRDWWTVILQIVCPVLCVLLAMALDFIHYAPLSSLVLGADVYPFETMSDVNGCQKFFSTNDYRVPGSAVRVHMNELNMLNTLNMSWYHVDRSRHHLLPHLSSFSCADPEYAQILSTMPIVIFYNTSANHEIAIAMNTLYSMILRGVMNQSMQLRTTASTLLSETDVSAAGNVKMILKGIILMIPFSILPSNAVSSVVGDRETGVRHIQNLAGLRFLVYWAVNFLFDITFYFVTIFLVILIMLIFEAKEFVGSDTFGPTFALLTTFGFTGTSMAYALQFAFNKQATAQIRVMVTGFVFGFLLVNVVFILSMIGSCREFSNHLRWVFRLVPTYALGEGIINLATYSFHKLSNPDLVPWSMDVCGWSCLYMACEFVFLFPITLVMDYPELRLKLRKLRYHPNGVGGTISSEDSDVEDERMVVYNQISKGDLSSDAVTVQDLRKVYRNGKVAIRNITFSVMKGEVFGFLGTNGAGKTTTMSILCQKCLPSSGRVFVCGHDVAEEGEVAKACIGYCPQFDACVDLLTVEEHLRMYAGLYGILKSEHIAVVKALMQLCDIYEYRDTLSRELSGGNRRKLSLAMALIGKPMVVLLDEPSAGMDPVARRRMWTSIEKIVQHCSVVLTTHHLEEVEALADCIAIMVDGVLCCIGNKTDLKDKYGGGLEMNLRIQSPSFYHSVEDFVGEHFPGAELNEYRSQRFVYSLPKGTQPSTLFAVLEQKKTRVGITDYSISQTSIEQVFMRFSKNA